jgi:hypothetical protein
VKRSIVMVGVLGVVSCGDNEHRARIVMEMGDDAPAYGRSPFPTDALVEGRNIGPIAGLDRMAKQHFDLIGAHLSTLDGWGLRPTVQFSSRASSTPARFPKTRRVLSPTR